jgi:CRP/FNR family transcriptional regulator, dissimilatory nitrate respiration regulator
MPFGLQDRVIRVLRQSSMQNKPGSSVEQTDSATTCLLSGLAPEDLQFILSHSHTADYVPQQEIVAQGGVVKYLCLILHGQVKTMRCNDDGKEAAIRLLRSGETFMDAVIFMGGVSPISAQAMEQTSLLQIPADIVRRHVLKDPQFASNILRIVTAHYKNAIQQMESIVNKSPVERLGYYLLKLHLEQGVDRLDFDFPFQKAVIANQLGMTPETFSRALAQIKRMGIDVDQKHISLKDSYTLCHFCDWESAGACARSGSADCPDADDCTKAGRC